ncbi:flagellin [Arthrobacter sp. yr096]|uniref:flagellin N-terminal helical domain-containing protein n=1 Tax=unclassified Arthrobacter TaxID=235627 RepID=UPI0008967DB6|nr:MULTISPECIES: flagellin [unclassified Arthrobacter]SDV99707.1 flagellin [Arthrobacter sp. cf158]SEI83915.1 flagellin [Arthrobacter sp. yr096]
MGMQINNNLMANNAYRNLNATQDTLSKSMEKLSSGLRINRAADDAAGLAISEGLKSQVSGSAVAARNAQDGISLIQTTEGALGEVHSVLQRMRDLAVQGASDTNNTAARDAIKDEADSLGKELDRITQSTNFNGIDLLKGGSKNIQVGTAGTANDTIAVNLGDVATAAGTLSSATGATGFDVTTNAAAQTTITAIDAAITAVSAQRSDLGANQNRLDHAIKTLNVSGENLQAAQSRIADTDMAAEMVKYTKANILSQAGTAMLAQANQSGQGVLSLLR